MKEAASMRQAMAELNWGRNPSAVLWVGSRAVHQYWALLAPYFRDVLLAPQRRSEDQILAWSWRENGESRQPAGPELAALRKRLAGDLQAFTDNASDGTDEGRGPVSVGNQPGIAQIAAAMEGWVSRLLAMTDGEFAAYVACTEAGLRLHSWGLTTAAAPFYPDERKATKEEASESPDEPSAAAAPAARSRRRIGWVLLAVVLLAGGLWIGRQVWLSAGAEGQTADASGARREAGGFNLSKLRQASGGTDHNPRESGSAQALEKRTTAGSGAVGGQPASVGPDATAVFVKTSRKTEAAEAARQNTEAASGGEPTESQGGDQRLFVGGAGTAAASDSMAGGAAAPSRHGVAMGGVSAAPSGGGASSAVSTAMPASQSETSPGGAPRLPSTQTSTSGAPSAPREFADRVSVAAADTLAPHQKSASAPVRVTEETKVEAQAASATAMVSSDDGVEAGVSRAPERAAESSDAVQVREKQRANAAGKASPSSLAERADEAVAALDTPWVRVVRAQAGEWRVRLLGESILPTQPMRAGTENSLEAMRDQALAERRAQLPAVFASVRGRRGFTVESTAGPLRWQVSVGAETVSIRADGNRAEIFWAEGEPPAPGIYGAVDEQGRAVARLEVGADRAPVLALAAEIRGWCWLALEGEVTSFIGRRLAEETMPSDWRWTTEARGARLEIPLTTPVGTTEIETVALLEPTTGWAVVSPITLTATSALR